MRKAGRVFPKHSRIQKIMCLHGINLHLLLSPSKEVVTCNFYPEAISFTLVVITQKVIGPSAFVSEDESPS